jgi:5'-methylthioadenosine phosphorylase
VADAERPTEAAARAEVGVYGGTGFYELLDGAEELVLDTPYGPPSAPVTIGVVEGRRVAFLPRHGRHHEHPPHLVPYRANAWAMHALGVRTVLGPCAAGSLQPRIEPGHLVVADQLVDRTWGRPDTFCDGPPVTHLAFADPYDAAVRSVVVDAARAEGVTVHDGGTVVVIPGPRFATRAESRWYRANGWDVINMTQYPEAALAGELAMAYAGVALVTDHDSGVEGEPGIAAVTQEAVFAAFAANLEQLKAVLHRAIALVPFGGAPGSAS